jgi:hypothetical protein
MGKDAFEDPELVALLASMRPAAGPLRWGRILTGVLVVGCATFAAAYYVPLRSAHEMLTARFAELQSKVDTSSRAAEDARGRAKELDDKMQALQSKLTAVEQRETAGADGSRAIQSALESKLQKPIASEQVVVGMAKAQSVVSLSLGSLLTRGKLEVSPAGKVNLCSVASASNDHAVRVVALAAKKDIPAALAAKLKTPLEYNLAVAELVTKTLLEQCKLAPTKLSASAVPAEPSDGPKLEGKKLDGARVELWIEAGSK